MTKIEMARYAAETAAQETIEQKIADKRITPEIARLSSELQLLRWEAQGRLIKLGNARLNTQNPMVWEKVSEINQIMETERALALGGINKTVEFLNTHLRPLEHSLPRQMFVPFIPPAFVSALFGRSAKR